MDEQGEEQALREPTGPCFQAVRIFCYGEICLLYMLVFFNRLCPSVVAESMAADYGVEKAELGVFSSVFFYPYALLQPFAGTLADLMEAGYIIGFSQLLAAIGAVIVRASNGIGLGCFGRFLTGFGCGPTSGLILRSVVNWFPFSIYPHISGLLLALGSVGGMIGQAPLAAVAEARGWRWCFYGIGIIGGALSLIHNEYGYEKESSIAFVCHIILGAR